MVESDRAVAFATDDILFAAIRAHAEDPSPYVISEGALSRPEPSANVLRRDDPGLQGRR